jgi:hypothetical protein
MISNGNSWHAVLFGFLDQLVDARGTVEHTKLRMIMEV